MTILLRAYHLVGRIISPFAIIGLRLFEVVFNRGRARIVVVNRQNHILLVSGVVSQGEYTLPGGGINRNEEAIDAAIRELREEVGIHVKREDVSELMRIHKDKTVPYNATIFIVKHDSTDADPVSYSRFEIRSMTWVDQHVMPANIDVVTARALSILSSQS